MAAFFPFCFAGFLQPLEPLPGFLFLCLSFIMMTNLKAGRFKSAGFCFLHFRRSSEKRRQHNTVGPGTALAPLIFDFRIPVSPSRFSTLSVPGGGASD